MSRAFHTIVHAVSEGVLVSAENSVDIDGSSLSCLSGPLETAGFAMSYEQLSERFESIERMFLEPDGSFVWVVEENGRRDQLDGLIVDDGQRVLTVEAKGTASKEMFDRMLETLGWPGQAVVIQLVNHGVYVREPEFRQHFVT